MLLSELKKRILDGRGNRLKTIGVIAQNTKKDPPLSQIVVCPPFLGLLKTDTS